MLKSSFYYDLPPELIAQRPASPRDSSRLFCLQRAGGAADTDCYFRDLPSLLRPEDVLVVNNSKVMPARLIGHREPGGGVCELLLLRQQQGDRWECLAKPGKRLREGTRLVFGDGTLIATVHKTLPDGCKWVDFQYDTTTLYEKLDAFGQMPLPPYIRQQVKDNAEYQTVYAREVGSAAAPTAGLHFTQDLLQTLKQKGIAIAELTLHVGLGTFRPVQREHVEEHEMHSEWYSLDEAAVNTIRQGKQQGGRTIAVGTTSCRTLEAVASRYGELRPASGETDIFIYPGYEFKAIDGLITNFHLPESTLIMLVAAFCGYENTMKAYRLAVEQRYRFFSFGDAMFII